MELADTQDLGSCAFGCEGSSPSFGTVFDWARVYPSSRIGPGFIRPLAAGSHQAGCRLSSNSGFWATPTSALGTPVIIAYVAPAIAAPTSGPMMNSHT